jgi:tetratricopeptide (TPR) repeat protein
VIQPLKPDSPLDIATDMPDVLDVVDLLEEGRRFEAQGVLDRAMESYTCAAKWCDEAAVVAEALTHQSRIHRCHSEWTPATETARRAQEVAVAAGLDRWVAEGLIAEANVLICRGEYPEALRLFERTLAMVDDARVRGIALQNIGSIYAQQGKLRAAELAFGESLGCFRRAGYGLGEATALNNYGRVALDRGNGALAQEILEEALLSARAVGYTELIALTTLNLAEAFVALGDLDRAEENAGAALGHFASSGNRWREIECLRTIGSINERRGCVADAVRCYELALSVANQLGAHRDERILRECLFRVHEGER